jgi:anti-sigma B factor antagonist
LLKTIISRAGFEGGAMSQSGSAEFGAEIKLLGGKVTVTISGEVDLSCADALLKCLGEAASKSAHITVDLSNVTFIDSSGLGALVVAQKQLRGNDGSLTLRSPQKQARAVIRIAGLDEMLPIERRGSC